MKGTDLTLCPECECHLVYPTAWSEVGEIHWHLHLRCPNCEWEGEGVWDHDTVCRFDSELTRATTNIEELVDRMQHEASW